MKTLPKEELDQIVIDLHNIARRIENSGNPDQLGYAIRDIADKLATPKPKEPRYLYVYLVDDHRYVFTTGTFNEKNVTWEYVGRIKLETNTTREGWHLEWVPDSEEWPEV